MRRLFMVAMVALLLGVPVTVLRAQDDAMKVQKLDLKLRHKQERTALKLRKKYWKESLQGQPLPKSERLRIKHQMQREERELRERQKDDLQDFKDRQRWAKEAESQL